MRSILPSILLAASLSPLVAAASIQSRCFGSLEARDAITPDEHNQVVKRCVAAFDRTNYNTYFAFGEGTTDLGYRVSSGVAGAETGNPTTPTGNWVSFLANTYNVTTINRRVFAQAQAYVNVALSIWASTPVAGVDDLVTQTTTDWKNNFVPSPAAWSYNVTKSLFLIWIGTNDVSNKFVETLPATNKAQNTIILDSYFAQLDIMRANGAPAFLLMNLPPRQRTPAYATNTTSSLTARGADIRDFNLQLTQRAWAYSQKWSLPVFVYDTYTFYLKVLDSPTLTATYGFTDNISVYPGTGNASTYVWGDTLRPGSAFHKFLAADVSAFLAVQSTT